MDEVEWSKGKTRSLNGFEDVQRQPVLLLLGLTLGLALAWVPALVSPIFAPFPPLIVGGVLTLFRRTQAVALGMIAAMCGIVVFLATALLLAVIFSR